MKKLVLINGVSNSPVVKQVTDGYTVVYVHENGTITANYSSIYATSFAKLSTQIKDEDTVININHYEFKMTYKGYYIGNEDDWMFNVGWTHTRPDDLAKASRDLALYKKNLIPFNALRKYNVINITNLYSQFDINRLIKFVIIPLAKEFSDLVDLEELSKKQRAQYSGLPYEDPKYWWDISPVTVKISKYQFKLVNNYYRTSKFIEWVLTDTEPKAVCSYSGIVTGIFNDKRTYQYDKHLTNVAVDNEQLTLNGWIIKADGSYASNEITKVNYYTEVKMPKTLDESLYDGKQWLSSSCLPRHSDYTNKQLLEIFKYSISTEDTVLECCYETTFRILGAIRYLKDLGYTGDMYINIQPKNTELPDIVDPIAKQKVFDTRDDVIGDLYKLGVYDMALVDYAYRKRAKAVFKNNTLINIGYEYFQDRKSDKIRYMVSYDYDDEQLSYIDGNGRQFIEGDFEEYGLIVISIK